MKVRNIPLSLSKRVLLSSLIAASAMTVQSLAGPFLRPAATAEGIKPESPVPNPRGASVGTAQTSERSGGNQRTSAATASILQATSAAGGEADYRIGQDDELDISVYGDADLMKTQTVRPGGKVSFPLIGDVLAAGRTPDELRQEIARRLGAYVKNARVTVIVSKYGSRRVSVLGEVKTPGVLRLTTEISILEGLSRAGGITEDADLRAALLMRGREVLPIDFEKLLRYGDPAQNVLLRPDDVILIPNVKDKKVSVLGELNKPQVLALRGEVTLIEAVSRAGGLTEEADLQGALLLRAGQVVPVDFERLLRQGDATQNVALRPDDAILIPSAKDKKVFLLGQVHRPAVIGLKGATSLIEAISRAGGVTDDADPVGALLLRDGAPVPVNFENLLRGDSSQNVLLRPNDVVLVPNVKDKKIFVLGEVTKPLVVNLRSGVNLIEAISLAGGFTTSAARKNVLLVRGGLGNPKIQAINVDEITHGGPLAQNLALQPGDIVYVPKSLVANVVKFFQDLSSILTPVILTQTGIVLGPAVEMILRGGSPQQQQPQQPTVINR